MTFEFDVKNLLRKVGAGDEARTRNFQLGNLNFRSFIFNTYKIGSGKMHVHALHNVHAFPDLRVAGRRLGDGVSDLLMYLLIMSCIVSRRIDPDSVRISDLVVSESRERKRKTTVGLENVGIYRSAKQLYL